MSAPALAVTIPVVAASYAIVWREGDGPVYAGKLALGSSSLRLEGGSRPGRHSLQKVFYDEIRSIHVGRRPGDRLDGRPALVLERGAAAPLRICAVAGAGTLTEIAQALGERAPASASLGS